MSGRAGAGDISSLGLPQLLLAAANLVPNGIPNADRTDFADEEIDG